MRALRVRAGRRRIRAGAAAFCVVMAVVLVTPSLALADTFRYSGTGADAMFDKWDGTTGAYTSAYMMAVDGKLTWNDPPGGRGVENIGKSADVFIMQFDPGRPKTTRDDVYREIWAYAYPANFTICPKLTGADLDMQVMTGWVYEWTGGVFNGGWTEPTSVREIVLVADATWTGVGSISRESFSWRYKQSGFMAHGRFSGTRRSADVVASVVDGSGVDYLAGAWGFGSLFKTRSSDTVID